MSIYPNHYSVNDLGIYLPKQILFCLCNGGSTLEALHSLVSKPIFSLYFSRSKSLVLLQYPRHSEIDFGDDFECVHHSNLHGQITKKTLRLCDLFASCTRLPIFNKIATGVTPQG